MSEIRKALTMPYPGLRPFQAEDQPLFFGREAQVNALLRQLEDHPFVAVVGSSGSGKSSLVRAGLLPAVREGFLFETTNWRSLVITPGHQPYQNLAHALVQTSRPGLEICGAPAVAEPPVPEVTTTHSTLLKTDRGLLIALDECGVPAGTRFIVVVDQFEELFAFRRGIATGDNVASRDEAAAFVNMLLRSCSESNGRVRVVLTMRSDFIGDCEAFLGLPEAISRSQFLVPRLDRIQMEEAIEKPGTVEDAGFERFTFEEGLVNRIINDAGDRPDQLPLMQHALMRTWKFAVKRCGNAPLELTHEDYRTAGRIENALSLHADAAWVEIKEDVQKAHIARRLFLLLCDISPDGQITRRRPQVAEVEAVTKAGTVEIEKVMRVFQEDDRNFLLPLLSQQHSFTSKTVLDISHEALLRQWKLFATEWQEQERQDASELRRLAELAGFRKQGQGGMLPPEDINRIARWKARVSPEWAHRYVKQETWDEVLGYIDESQRDMKQTKMAKIVVGAILIVAVIFMAKFRLAANEAAALARVEAENSKLAQDKAALAEDKAALADETAKFESKRANLEAEKAGTATIAAQEAQTQSFMRTIGMSENAVVSAHERAALWELAELDPAKAQVRENVINLWFQNVESSERALRYHARGLRAAVGMNVALRRHSQARAKELAENLVKAAEDPYGQEPSSSALAALAAQMEIKDVTSLATRLALVLERPQGNTTYRLSNLGSAQAALAARMDRQDAASITLRAAKVLAKSMETSNAQGLVDLSLSLNALAARMDAADAASAAEGGAQLLIKSLEKSSDSNPDNLSGLGASLADLTAWTNPNDAANFAARGAQVLVTAIENPEEMDSYTLFNLSSALARLASRLVAKDAATVANRLTTLLENPQKTSYMGLEISLVALAARIHGDDAASIADRLANAMENPQETNDDRLSTLGTVLAAMTAQTAPSEGTKIAARGARILALRMENWKETTRSPWDLSNALETLAARMDSSDAASIGDRLYKALEKPKQTNLRHLQSALTMMTGRMDSQNAASIADRLVTMLANPQETEYERLSSIGTALRGLADRLDPTDAAKITERLATTLANPHETENERLLSLVTTLKILANRLDPADAARIGEHLAKALENPQETNSGRLWALKSTLRDLAARMSPLVAAAVAARLSKAIENSQETNFERKSALSLEINRDASSVVDGIALAVKTSQGTDWYRVRSLDSDVELLSEAPPAARKTRLLAISDALMPQGPSPTLEVGKEAPKTIAKWCTWLEPEDLAEVLKWPFCVGETEQIVLAELEKKMDRTFGGDVWKFVEQADSLGIKNLDAPARRPRVEEVLKELETIRSGSQKSP